MAITQSTYVERIAGGVHGQVANTHTCEVDTYIVETAAIGFGVACQAGTADDQVKLGIAANKFVGVSIKDTTRDPADNDNYKIGAHASILTEGDIFIAVKAAVEAGDNVTAKTTTGELSTAAVSATQILISGARWMTSASANGLAVLRLTGELPVA